MPEVRAATLMDADLLVEVTSTAFYDDPVTGWVFPDPSERMGHLRTIFRGLVGSFLRDDGTIHLLEGASASFWRSPAFDHAQTEAGGDDRSPALPPLSLQRLRLVGAAVAEAHPHTPHWYLNVLGTTPERQGQGLGARVLQPVLTVCDSDGVPAYLESSNPRNIGFYQRLGFEPAGEIRVPEGPSLYPMWRQAGQNG